MDDDLFSLLSAPEPECACACVFLHARLYQSLIRLFFFVVLLFRGQIQWLKERTFSSLAETWSTYLCQVWTEDTCSPNLRRSTWEGNSWMLCWIEFDDRNPDGWSPWIWCKLVHLETTDADMCRWTRDDDERLSRSATGSPRLIGTRYRPGSSDLTTSISSSSVISRGALILAEVQTLMKIFALLVSSPSCLVFRQNPRWFMKDRSFFCSLAVYLAPVGWPCVHHDWYSSVFVRRPY